MLTFFAFLSIVEYNYVFYLMECIHWMKKKICLFIVFVLLFQFFSVSFTYAKEWNDEQPETCAWPSEMMSNYFEFQREMKEVLLWTKLNSERFSAEFGPWLFTNRVLEMSSSTAIDLLSSRVIWNIRSFVSNTTTSLFLLELAAISVVQSNTEGFAILFDDWPIVRDYKTMLDIETDLFDIAYFLSKEMNILQRVDSNTKKELKNVIKKYRDKWLLTGNDSDINGSIADVLSDLNSMNVVMKQFIMVGGKSIGNAWLRKYKWCFWNVWTDQCTDKIAILMFSSGAIDKLYDDYKDVRKFSVCNSSVNNFKSSLKKTIKNNSDAVSDAVQDVEDALTRLRDETLWNKKRWDFHDPCKDLSAYELAQLQAYWWWNWSCGNWINLFTTKKYVKDKIAHYTQKKKTSDILRQSVNSVGNNDLDNKMRDAKTYQERVEYYASQMDKWNLSQNYNIDLDRDFLTEMETTVDEFFQSQENAAATDVITLFWKIRWVLDQLDGIIENSNKTKKILKWIEEKACSIFI